MNQNFTLFLLYLFFILSAYKASAELTGTQPEIKIMGINSNYGEIFDGAITSSSYNNTDFGNVISSQRKKFIITNCNENSTTMLYLTGTPPVKISGNSHFTVENMSWRTSLDYNHATDFDIRYEPTITGNDTATVSIENTDSDENPFTFIVTGSCPGPQIAVYASYEMDNGDTFPTLSKGTCFPKLQLGKKDTLSFKIKNTGGDTLKFDTTQIPVLLDDSTHFKVIDQAAASILPGDSSNFKIQFCPASSETLQTTVNIKSNAENYSVFYFDVGGSGEEAPFTINTTVWYDANENGIIDPDEKGLENVVINLLESDNQIAKHLTNKQGFCHFTFLQSATYTVQIKEATLPKDAVCCTTDGLIKNVNPSQENGWIDLEFGFCGENVNIESDDTVIPESYEAELLGKTLVIVPDTGTPSCMVGKCQTTWENLVDLDYDGWDGTVVAATPTDGSDPQVILMFADQNIYKFNYIQFQTDNGNDDDHVKHIAQADELQVFVSTTGQEDADWQSIGTFACSYGRTKMQWFKLNDFVSAKYIKLVITKPNSLSNKQLVEFAVNTSAKGGAVPANETAHSVVQIPQKTQLLPSYPNPFNPTVSIPFELNQKDHVNLTIFDLKGRLIAKLVNADLNSGKHEAIWNGITFPSGVYFINFRTSRTNQNQSIILLK